MSNILFSSDTHFGHKNMMKFSPRTRPYSSVEEMDELMIKTWNERVRPEDDVFHLGDFSFYHTFEKQAAVARRLNGRILSQGLIYSIENYREIRVEGQKAVLMHFPLAVWHKNHRGAFNLYGHCHGSFKAVGKQMDVGWDTADMGPNWVPGPISWSQIKKVLDAREMVVQDHHTPMTGRD
jgi:calcineurin-like phosphoesterase family protein